MEETDGSGQTEGEKGEGREGYRDELEWDELGGQD